MPRIKIYVAFFLLYLSWSEAYKILVAFPFPGKSHSLLGDAHVRLLLEAGHEVTYITAFPKKEIKPNLHVVDVSALIDVFPEDMMDLKNMLKKENEVTDFKDSIGMIKNLTESTFKVKNMQRLLNDPDQHFDVIVAEWMFGELLSSLSAVFEVPYIWFISFEPNSWVLSLIDETTNPAYKANFISSNIPPFTFVQRVQELWNQYSFAGFWIYYVSRNENELYEDVIGPILAKKGRPLPPFDEVKYNASLMLANSHVAFGHSLRLPQNCKPIAGFHIEPKLEPLNKDLKNILDNASNGFIYFSMGSNLKSKDWPLNIKQDLLKMFSELKQTVLWKFEEESLEVPNNVHLLKWAPQHSILAHPNCVLFITHGGFLSTTETVHYGVPVIGIPVFADQFVNVKRSVQMGIGKEVKLSYTVADDLKVAIAEVINNPRYRERVKELSLVYHDRVAAPGAELVHWVEHVVRTRGAPHLRSPALMVPWYQKLYLDLIALILGAIIVIKITLKRIFCRKKQHKQTQKEMKKNQ